MQPAQHVKATTSARGVIICWACQLLGGTLQRDGVFADGSTKYRHPTCRSVPATYEKPAA